MEKLLPCPFCGGGALMQILGGPKSDHRTIQCVKCKCDLHWQVTEELAIAAWNRRPREAELERVLRMVIDLDETTSGDHREYECAKKLQALVEAAREVLKG